MGGRNQLATVAMSPAGARGRQTSLSRERILEVALELLDRDGLDALSMRRLADQLGAGTMTLYGYFHDKGELLDAVADAALSEEPLPPLRGSWKSRLRLIAQHARRSVERHPALGAARLTRPMLSPGALRLTEAAAGILRRAGFDAADAARAYRLMFSYVVGFASFSPQGSAQDLTRAAHAAIARLSPDEYPVLTGMASAAADAMGGDEQFEYGLALILDGLEARLQGVR